MRKIHLYFRTRPLGYRYLPGDRKALQFIRRLIKGKKVSGVKKVFSNLCKGLNKLHIDHDVNLPFNEIKPGEPVVILGDGSYALEGYNKPNPVIAGIGLMTHPADWPGLFKEYPIAKYLQHSAWANDLYTPYYGEENCVIWPAGIDTQYWTPKNTEKKYDFLVYDKILWPQLADDLVSKITGKLTSAGHSFKIIKYGSYKEPEYFKTLQQSRAMIFLCEHESQGFACCEALSTNIPVFAWDQGFWLDPNRFKWNSPVVKATSIPFFNNQCGMSFKDPAEFNSRLDKFWIEVTENRYNPREYILDHLTLEKSAGAMLRIIESVYSNAR